MFCLTFTQRSRLDLCDIFIIGLIDGGKPGEDPYNISLKNCSGLMGRACWVSKRNADPLF